MRSRLALTAALLAALPPGHGVAQVRLSERLPAPLLMLIAEAPPSGTKSTARVLADHPGCRALLERLGLPAQRDGESAVDQIRELIELSTGEIEIAVSDLPTDASAAPSFVCRLRLEESRAKTIGAELAAERLTTPHRRVGSCQTHHMRSAPDSAFEVALVDQDLLAGNDARALEKVLLSLSAAAPAARDSMAADPGFASLQQRLAAAPGSVAVFLRWDRVTAHLKRAAATRGDAPSARDALLHALGLPDAQRVALACAARSGRIETTVVIEQPRGPAGVFKIARDDTVRALLDRLPLVETASFVLAVDLDRIARTRPDDLAAFRPGFGGELVGFALGIDPELRQCLAPAIALQILPVMEEAATDAAAGAACLLSLLVKNRGDAAVLFDELVRGVGGTPLQLAAGRTGLRVGAGVVAVVGDRLTGAADTAALDDAVRLEAKLTASARDKKKQHVRQQLALLDVERAAGLLRLDFGEPARVHTGALFVEPDLIKLRMVTPM